MKAVVVLGLLAGCDVVFRLGGRVDPDATTIDGLPACGTPERARNPAGCPCETVNAVNQCFAGDPGTPFNPSACSLPGQVTCGDTHVWSECIGASQPTPEVCFDTTDNNCDGMADEGCSCANGDNLCLDPDTGEPFGSDHLWTSPNPARRNQGFAAFGVSKEPIPDPALDVEDGECTGAVTTCTMGGACTGWFGAAVLSVPTDTDWFPNLGDDRVRILRNSGPVNGGGSPCNPGTSVGAIVGTVEIIN